jgi:hypothetical protein
MQSELVQDISLFKWHSEMEYYSYISDVTNLVKFGREQEARFPVYHSETHPDSIMIEPKEGMYCLLAMSPASVCFPKLANPSKKRVTWQRQGTVTHLPQQGPLVSIAGAAGHDKAAAYELRVVWRCEDLRLATPRLVVCLVHVRKFEKGHWKGGYAGKENKGTSLPQPGPELDQYLLKVGEQINRRRIEEAARAKACQDEAEKMRTEGRKVSFR